MILPSLVDQNEPLENRKMRNNTSHKVLLRPQKSELHI